MTARELLSYFEGVRPIRGGWQARCPAHDDHNPSLSVAEEGGRILLHCHAGCSTESVLQAVGLCLADLFTDREAPRANMEGKPEAVYPYTDETGKLLFQVLRLAGKEFPQRRPNGHGGWHWNLNGTRRVLFNLPAVLKADVVLVCEGEKDCGTAGGLDFVATCNPGGAGNWHAEFAEYLRGKRVVIICDADSPGQDHGRDVARSLVGIAASVQFIEALPGVPHKGDLTDYTSAGGTRESLLKLIGETPELTAGDVATWKRPKSTNGFTLVPLGELLSKPDVPVEFIWDGRLVAGTVSGIFAKPKVGKGTLARNLCLAVARGEDFLGRRTKQGDCIYLALEERDEDVKNDFRAMGADGTEPILVHAAAAPAEGIRALCELVRERKPRLVVIDPIIRLARVRDENAYAEAYTALGPLIDAARETGTHIMLLHHSGKALKPDPTDAPLGTTAIAGLVATLIVLKRTETYRTVQTVQRIGEVMPETVLQFDPKTKRLSLGGTREEAETDSLSVEIMEFIKAAGEPRTEPEVVAGVEGKTKFVRRALRRLVGQGAVSREGAGKRGDPYRYSFSFSCSQNIAGTREQETGNTAQTCINAEPILVPDSQEEAIPVPPMVFGKL